MQELSAVEAYLDDYCLTKIAKAGKISDRYAVLWQEIRRYILAGGKRMRPRLVLLAYQAYGGKDTNNIVPVAAAWELLHACLLVHDDIIDRDTIRHGQPNLSGRYLSIYKRLTDSDTKHQALSAALLGGDLLLMAAYEIVNSSAIADTDKLRVTSYINKALFSVAGGELIDMDSIFYPIDESDSLNIIKHKTASYSLQLPLECGAELAGASNSQLIKLSELGLHSGIAFQLHDDILGVFGDSKKTGKPNNSDIVEKKRTLLIYETAKRLEPKKRQLINDIYQSSQALNQDQVTSVVELINLSGAKEAILKIINDETKISVDIIESLKISQHYKDIFSILISSLANRTK